MNQCSQPRKTKRRKCQIQSNQTLTSGHLSRSKNASIKENKTSKKVLEKYRPLPFIDQNPLQDESESETESFELDAEGDIMLCGNESDSTKALFTRLKCNSPVKADQITPSLDCQFNTPEHISDNNGQVAENPETNSEIGMIDKCVRNRDGTRTSPNAIAALTDHNWNSDRTIPILCQTDDDIILEMREIQKKSRKVTREAEMPNFDTPRRRSRRLVERNMHKLTFGANDFSSLMHTPQRETLDELTTPNRTVRILVDDTPELDYGLRVSLRRRRELLPHMTWVKLLHNTSVCHQ
ncbi:uncharacterized protein LOC100367503 isoform X2 [Saccoglossus kowalevskii]